ncbi:MAG: GNAT family N-acetyltransferase [Glaciecola sp.]|jgi:N-acetylglutamate synthase-like GNAT family acetyltransferase|nr:GNAT family N-acetyltransferase [Glaciecola sp.]MDG1816145.1 GNAT family N-acetyltransferase [Glaciecola sp.]MDG2098732.1 GNAT family N-acetyltransferase [Glaciecola sp.]
MSTLRFITYEQATPEQQTTFAQFNLAWIEQYFVVEAKDEHSLHHPDTAIIAQGGQVLFGIDVNNQSVIVCALLRQSDDVFELSKMGMKQSEKGQGYAEKMVTATLNEARRMGAKMVFLESNRILKNALYIYEKCGFIEVPMLPSPYARADIRMELNLG